MVFSSVPLYLDHPHYQQLQAAGGNSNYSTVEETSDQYYMLAPPAMPALQPPASAMVQMGPAVKCPRCGSGNTKFCYYNNYSLSQPRHLCKNCRRYWTRGGVLRNVPVGGGSRTTNNKTTKSRSRRSNNKRSSSSNSSPMMMMMHHEQQYYHHNFMQQPNDLLHVNRRSFGAHADVGPSQAPAGGGGEQFANCNWLQIDDGSSSTNNYKFDQGLFDGMINFHY